MARAERVLSPSLALDEVFGDGVTYNPREPYGGNPFVGEDAPVSNALTGGQLVIAGGLRVMCHRAVARDQVLDLVRRAGFVVHTALEPYGDQVEYEQLLAGKAPGTVVFQHAHPPEQADPSLYWIPKRTLETLNDKSCLNSLAPAAAIPRRDVVPTRGHWAAAQWAAQPLPVVVKVPSHHSLGAGEGVRICRDRAGLRAALDDFAAADELVVEEFLDVRTSWCVQFACLADGSVRWLGGAEQLVDDHGHYWGNWISASPQAEAAELGREIAARGAAAGYRGVAGFDIALTGDGRLVALDCNFRINGSTVGLLCHSAIQELHGAAEIQFRTVRDSRGWASLCGTLEPLAREGRVLPYAGYDPAGEPASGIARASVLVTGPTREDVARTVDRLLACGLE